VHAAPPAALPPPRAVPSATESAAWPVRHRHLPSQAGGGPGPAETSSAHRPRYPSVTGGTVPSPGRCTLWALAVAVGSLCSCGGSEQSQTCLERTITYTGSKSGAAYSRTTSDDGGRALFYAGNAASIQFLIFAGSGNLVCSHAGEHKDIPFTAVVWIDVSGTAAANCSDLL